MTDYTKQVAGAAYNNLPQVNPLTDIYSNKLSTYQTTQPTQQFSCTPSQYGCIPTPMQPNTSANNITFPQQVQQIPQTISPAAYDVQYLNQFLATQIGRQVTVEFLIGTNTFTTKSGELMAVGTNYILIKEINSDDIVACDFYNIKFVTFFY